MSYFDDNVTDKILQNTSGEEDKLDLNVFASSIEELSEWKAKEQEKITNQVITERDNISDKLDKQTHQIIEGAVESCQKILMKQKIGLWLIEKWPITISLQRLYTIS